MYYERFLMNSNHKKYLKQVWGRNIGNPGIDGF